MSIYKISILFLDGQGILITSSTSNNFPLMTRRIRVRLVMEFKNCYLKICENCSLKSIIEKRVINGYKTKKCVWYHGLNNMFLVFKKHKNVFGTYV